MTQEEVDLIYDYLHKNYYYRMDGLFLRKKDNSVVFGSQRSQKNNLMYSLNFYLSNKKIHIYYSHAVYLYHKKIKPKYLNYINNNFTDCRIENLELTTMSKRNLNSKIGTINKHGFKGVCKDGNKYYARIMINKKYIWLSSHTTPEEAHEAYLKAKKEMT